jgi:ribosomal 50S subunit-recycling heat shock protein
VNGIPVRSVDDVKVGAEIEVSIIDGIVTGAVTGRSKEKRWQSQ